MFHYYRAQGHIAAYIANRIRWHWYPRFRFVCAFPDHVDIEISSACNMQCPMCYTITDEFKKRVQKQSMDLSLFTKLVAECADNRIYSIRISLRGEPFIHPDVIPMIRYAKQAGIKEISALTNALALTPELFAKAMEAGLSWLTISFDGLGETYEGIRKPARFAEALAKIKEYHRIKKNAGSIKPVIKIQTVWPAIKNNAKKYFETFAPYVQGIAVNPLIDYLHKDDRIEYIRDFVCPVLYQRLVIGSDGIALLCSNDEFCLHAVGDTNKETIKAIWHGKKLTEARKINEAKRCVHDLLPCKHCFLPRKTIPVAETFGNGTLIVEKYLNRPDSVGA